MDKGSELGDVKWKFHICSLYAFHCCVTLVLLQRALRINPKSASLWTEYFRFELSYINLIDERRRILGLTVSF